MNDSRTTERSAFVDVNDAKTGKMNGIISEMAALFSEKQGCKRCPGLHLRLNHARMTRVNEFTSEINPFISKMYAWMNEMKA